MKTFFRVASAALTLALMLSWGIASPIAQEADEPALVSKTYNVRNMVGIDLERTPRTGAVGDVLAPDRVFAQEFPGHPLEGWDLRDSGDEARCWYDSYELFESLEYLLDLGSEDELYMQSEDPTLIKVEATEAAHKRIRWALDALADITEARASISVYRIEDSSSVEPVLNSQQAADLARGKRLVGTLRGGLGEPLVLQQTQHRSYVADYDLSLATGVAGSTSEVRDLHTGEEFVLGALSLPNGRIWLQGWHARVKDLGHRDLETTAGPVELPRIDYSFTPISTVIDNGGGAILDAGKHGRFLVNTRCSRTVKNHELKLDDGSRVLLVNCAPAMHGHGLGGFWLMNPTSNRVMEDGVFPQVIFVDPADGPYNDSAQLFAERIEEFHNDVYVIGPYLGVHLPGPDEDADYIAGGRKAEALLEAIGDEPGMVGVRISAWEVADDSAIPQGVLDGRPGDVDLAELASLAGNEPLFSRVSSAIQRQQTDMLDVRMSAHLRDYDLHTATEAIEFDPEIATLVTGSQVRWTARDAGNGRISLELRTGITAGGDEFEKVTIGTGDEKRIVERSSSALTQARFSDELSVGERMATISPGAGVKGQLIVIVVERLK